MQASARLSSSAAFRKVIAGVSGATTRSCYQISRGKAHAAPLSAQEPPQKGRKRLTNEERRLRVMEFVENYRASNDGKYPTLKSICQEVRSGQHTVRLILQEIKYYDGKLAPDKSKAAAIQVTVKVIDQPRPEGDKARVDENQGILEDSDHSMPKDDAKVAQLQGPAQVFDHSFPKDEGKVAQCEGTFQFPDLSCGKTAKHDVDTAADAPALSDQTKSERMKGLMDNPDPGNQQREIEANQFDLKNSEKDLIANDSNGSEQTGSDMMNEAAKTHAREENQKLEESTSTGLLGSLKSFAYGIRNLWKNM